ncbi:M1 family metallopeptidase [Nocardioides campestrisoli]|uniref:M1 family metallopeptidase n=1 Tax=Nocardioides campestrisoli TaxID=2736757 RepID=UPI001C627F5C|nr:M1 family metallopeptidase [Nocardioides campestrisoli]
MSVRHRRTIVGAVLAALLASGASAAPAATPGVGAPGAGDPYFPLAGNRGYDVQHYDLTLDYTPPRAGAERLTGRLDAVAKIRMVPTKRLTRFNLDLRGLRARSVRVDGRPARFRQVGDHELVITPSASMRPWKWHTVVVRYGGATDRPKDVEGALYGWVTTRDGAIVVNEPDGAPTWFPVNDTPKDKATYRFEVTVPKGLSVAANGLLESRRTHHGRTTWVWDAPDQMASYLATATIGDFRMRRSTVAGDLPVIDFLDRDLPAEDRSRSRATLALTGEMVTFFEARFGPYPFVAYGATVDDDSVGYALETQTRSVFSKVATESTAAHELAHQWLGNRVGPRRWSDIWLNEGWAEYSSWLWTEFRGGTTTQEAFDEVLAIPADDDFWTTVVSDPGRDDLFADAVYERGAATLHALRHRLGDAQFFQLAKSWIGAYGGQAVTTEQFRRLAEAVSGQDLDAFFDTWLDAPVKPASR